jgi:hypothetical protein
MWHSSEACENISMKKLLMLYHSMAHRMKSHQELLCEAPLQQLSGCTVSKQSYNQGATGNEGFDGLEVAGLIHQVQVQDVAGARCPLHSLEQPVVFTQCVSHS